MIKGEFEERMAAALEPFGWTCTETFWQRYHTDPWVFNLANAVERLTEEVKRLEEASNFFRDY